MASSAAPEPGTSTAEQAVCNTKAAGASLKRQAMHLQTARPRGDSAQVGVDVDEVLSELDMDPYGLEPSRGLPFRLHENGAESALELAASLKTGAIAGMEEPRERGQIAGLQGSAVAPQEVEDVSGLDEEASLNSEHPVALNEETHRALRAHRRSGPVQRQLQLGDDLHGRSRIRKGPTLQPPGTNAALRIAVPQSLEVLKNPRAVSERIRIAGSETSFEAAEVDLFRCGEDRLDDGLRRRTTAAEEEEGGGDDFSSHPYEGASTWWDERGSP